jgi:nicotinate-nucleotide pyrophosphorylase (carboxylating)
VEPGDEIIQLVGKPKQIAMAEDRLIGIMAKPSGIATSARRFVEKAGSRPRIVSGTWKKMPLSQKETIQRAVLVGGAGCRICDKPFLYLDKNYVKILGGLTSCLDAVAGFDGYVRVVQLKNDDNDISDEACQAVRNGANIVFIDSGRIDDLDRVSESLKQVGLRDRVEIAFGGNIRLENIDVLKTMDVDILDIGRAIVDAPLLDMRMEVIEA